MRPSPSIAAIQPPSGAPSVVVYQNTSLGILLTLHFTLYDATGDSAVIEYVSNGSGGSAISIITPNPVGVCTIKNFATLDPNLAIPIQPNPLGTYNLVFHLLNGVDIPYGVSEGEYPAKSGPPTTGYDHTQWIVVKDLDELGLSDAILRQHARVPSRTGQT